ncbi:hypothetical protein [uncultured Kordia sp.]|uniref:hypothetical protein n=1 Tax=uncultured Kordia sp. TaxID=507699 RepID=UPI002604BC1C|nr:hypothetical protein [uncultured Kordia sp.]
MLKKILNAKGVQTLNKKEQAKLLGGLPLFKCVPVTSFCIPQSRANGKLVDRQGNFIRCCYVATSIATPIGS